MRDAVPTRAIAALSAGIICIAAPGIMHAAPTDLAEHEVSDLQGLIVEKQTELQALQRQREELEAKLAKTGEKKASLQNELDTITYRIRDLENSIYRNTLIIEKLGLEITSLEEEMKHIDETVRGAKDSVARLLVELQQTNGESLLTILLKHRTLSESASAIQSVVTLASNLSTQARELNELQESLKQKQKSVAQKKVETEVEQSALINRQSLVEDAKSEKEVLLAQTQNEEEQYQEKIQKLQNEQDEISGVMTAIEKRLRETIDASLLPVPRPGILAVPVKDTCVTQEYGSTDFAQQAYRTSFHTGLDLRAPTGEPVYAALDGFVAAVDDNDRGASRWQRYQYGKYIIIQHENNLSTLYAHLSRTAVGEGQAVKKGDLIGYAGNTGYTFGAHLHFGVYATPVMGWQERTNAGTARDLGGLIRIPPAAGLVPVGATLDPSDYLYPLSSCYD